MDGSEMLVARKATKDSVAFGTVLLVMGIFAVIAPLFGGIAVTMLIGMLLMGAAVSSDPEPVIE